MNTTKTVSTKVQAYVMVDTGRKDAKGKAIQEPALDAEANPIPAPEQKTALTINWDGCTPEEILQMAQAALIVKLQGKWRKDGIPREATVNASDYKVGTRVAAVKKTLDEQVADLDAAGKKALLARLLAEAEG